MNIKDKLTRPLKQVLKSSVMSKLFAEVEDEDSGQSVRTSVGESVATSINPDKLFQVMDAAKQGDTAEWMELAEEMEERDGHYASVLSTRKLALAGIPGEIHAASEEARDKEIAEAVENDILKHPEFPILLRNLLAGLGRSFAVCEIIWDTSDPTRWKPKQWVWTDPRWFRFDKKTKRILKLRDKDQKDGLDLPERKYIIHIANLKPGLPIRSGLAWLVVWAWLLKSYSIKDWARFAELFGQPLRLGKYPSGTPDKDKRALLTAVRRIARDAAAIIPDGMDIEMIKVDGKGDPVFAGFADYLDRQISKAVLGQTMTSDDGSSMAQAEVHNEVRLDLLQADAIDLAVTINRDLIRPYCLTNYGELESYPTFKIDVTEGEDLELLSKIWERLHRMGLPIGAMAAYDTFGIPEPEAGDTVIEPRHGKSQHDKNDDRDDEKASNREHPHSHEESDRLDQVALDGLDGWRMQMDGVFEPVAEALARNTTVEGFAKDLDTLLARQDMGELTDALAAAGIKARAHGEDDAAKEVTA